MAHTPHIFLDNQLSPSLADWIGRTLGVRCTHISTLRPKIVTDHALVRATSTKGGIILSKDDDFATILRHRPAPPDLIWLRCGNRSNRLLKDILKTQLPRALDLIKLGEHIVEIRDRDAHSSDAL